MKRHVTTPLNVVTAGGLSLFSFFKIMVLVLVIYIKNDSSAKLDFRRRKFFYRNLLVKKSNLTVSLISQNNLKTLKKVIALSIMIDL